MRTSWPALDIWRDVWSITAGATIVLSLLPSPLRSRLEEALRYLLDRLLLLFSSASHRSATVRIPASSSLSPAAASSSYYYNRDDDDDPLQYGRNPLYDDVALYLSTLDVELRLPHVQAYSIRRSNGATGSGSVFLFGLPLDQTLADSFCDCEMLWVHTTEGDGRSGSSGHTHHGDSENASYTFVLTLPEAEKARLLCRYLGHIAAVASRRREESTQRILYANKGNGGCGWTPYVFKHPSTFDSLALSEGLEQRIRQDLAAFSAARQFYHASGRPWKRGYLLYGPPGTGKSSLIAAIANFLHYDVYDLELTNVYSNTQLRQLLMQTTRKSVIVIEDIDCAVSGRNLLLAHPPDSGAENGDAATPSDQSRLTLSGLLNFADGLMSCFGEERIFIFTTNHKERLNPALLRHGRMDMHILLSYCTFSAFKKLARNYLGVEEHCLFGEIEAAFERRGVSLTPASVAEILLSARENPDAAIQQVLEAVLQSTSGNPPEEWPAT